MRTRSIAITVSRHRTGDGTVAKIEVADEGPGIPEHLLPHVFDRFMTTRRARGAGLGLGLFLARVIAEEHRGDLTVSSVPGAGTRFTLRVPCLSD